MKLTRTQRLIRIVQILQAGRRCSVDFLAAELKVSRRTIFRDMGVLRDAGLVCTFEKASESYALEQAYFLKPVNLSLEEGLALMLLTRKFVDGRVLPSARSTISAGMKIEAVIPKEVREFCGALLEGVEVDLGKLSDVDPVSDVFIQMQRSIAAHRKVRIRYDSYFEQREISTILRPYRLTFRSRGWYAVGYSEKHRQVRTFKLERIIEFQVIEQRFRPDPDFNLDDYFGNAWHMIRGEERYHVEIQFSKKVAGNVEEVMWHPTQRTRRRSDGSLVFEVDVDGIDEITWWVLGYGDQAIVSEPDALRHAVGRHAHNLQRYYQNNRTTPLPRE